MQELNIMSDFIAADYDWLLLRYAADKRSRGQGLLKQLQTLLADKGEITVLDIGAGSGANLAFLAPRLNVSEQRWHLVDRDTQLTSKVSGALQALSKVDDIQLESNNTELRFSSGVATYTASTEDFLDVDSSIYQQAWDVVTANAVFDLLTIDQLRRFFILAKTHWTHNPWMYFTINLDSQMSFDPMMPEDEEVVRLFHLHMQRPQSFGCSLGNDSAILLNNIAKEVGFEVDLERSDWVATPQEEAFIHANLDFVESAVTEVLQTGISSDLTLESFKDWLLQRRDQTQRSQLSLTVEHQDFLLRFRS